MAENNKELEKMRNELKELVNNYTNLIKAVPLIKIDPENYDLDNIINTLKAEEDKMRNSEENMNNLFQTALKMLELRVNSNILHQHFLGCLNVANNCEDLMCFKIFMSQAYTAMLQQLSFIKRFLELFNEVEIEDIISQIKALESQKETLKSYNIKSQDFLDNIDKVVQELNEKVKEMPSKLY
ncbi:MAG: hypothetical protein ACTSRG_18750 [Candidatus Helarchaeota archaeon]